MANGVIHLSKLVKKDAISREKKYGPKPKWQDNKK